MNHQVKNNMKSWSVFARDAKTESAWVKEVRKFQKMVGGALGSSVFSSQESLGEIWLIDAKKTGWQSWLENQDRVGRTYLLVVEEGELLPDFRDLKWVDDMIVTPFRLVELLSKYRAHFQREETLMTELELDKTNEVLERILTAKTPRRFTGLKGIRVSSKHLSGLKPGGDYFDLFESDKKDYVNILLADSSSYGLSSVLLGMVLSNSARIANENQLRTSDWIQSIYADLKTALGEKESLSLFFGRLNRKDFTLHYQLFGSIEAYQISQDGKCKPFEKHGKKISSAEPPVRHEEAVVLLNPKDRLVLLSDGFVNGVGGDAYLNQVFQKQMEKDPFLLVNELSYRIKSKLVEGETFPGEDCSAIVMDIESRVLRLAPTG
jgi:sigma-B regulation protein RsbU (phosphoserine phosphatase)